VSPISYFKDYEFIKTEMRGDVLVATLDRPEKLNAVNLSEHDELSRLLRQTQEDDAVKVLVTRGNGRAFCIGGDYSLMEDMVADPRLVLKMQRSARELIQAHVDMEKPVVAAVHGIASGAGASFALMSDIIIVERSTRIGDRHPIAGLAAGDGGVLTWPLSVGMARAKRYLLTGDWIDAETAERIGLVTEVVDDGTCFDRAIEWAERLASFPPVGVQLTKRALNSWFALGMPLAFNSSLAFEMLGFLQPEAQELIRSIQKPAKK